MTIKQSDELAIRGGKPVRGPENPLPQVFPREIHPKAMQYVQEVLESGFTRDYTPEFEAAFAKANGVKHCVALHNCTAAVHAALAAVGLNPGDEVVVSPITDYGSVAGILWQNALPVFADVDLSTGNISAETIEPVLTERTKAIVAVHWAGLVCDMDPIMELAQSRGIFVIEDCCQTPLAEYRGRKAGAGADMGCFSFDAEKNMSTEHGGAVITNSDALAARVRQFALARGAAPVPGYGRTHEWLGLNYRFGALHSALGLAQLELLPEHNRKRHRMAMLLTEMLADVEGVHTPHVLAGTVPGWWLYWVRFEPQRFDAPVDEMCDALAAEGIPGSLGRYYLVPDSHTFLKDRAHAYGDSTCPFTCPFASREIHYSLEDLPNAVEFVNNTFRWGWTEKYTEQDVRDMAAAIRKVAEHYRKT